MGKVRIHTMLHQAAHRHHSMAASPNAENGGRGFRELGISCFESHAQFQESFVVMFCRCFVREKLYIWAGAIIWQGVCLSLCGEPGYENRKETKARKGLLHFSENVSPFWILSPLLIFSVQ
jgi:hypothetical protein